MKKYILLLIIVPLFSAAQQMVYKPLNPAFGGDTFNYQWLLSSASAQNQFDNNNRSSTIKTGNSLDSFTDNLNRQILNELSRKLFGDQFGDGELQPGTYVFGSIYLEVSQTSQGLLISILNTSTGEQSEIIIPGGG
ncbi:curli assembly protein CsgF [Chryseobacterium sp. 6424]|uniref:curli production assembly/transport component CsgF n=1 Tax=Chryseobacterium sp. 6424 TaxID=2039166 RepID=UPI000EFC74B5|nr:curli production assembly/transport component CsgF [Chryseobacterium sp. 6424]AYO57731.1 curli assembly protein CsgF [Chryseobacterium sp. 6424]